MRAPPILVTTRLRSHAAHLTSPQSVCLQPVSGLCIYVDSARALCLLCILHWLQEHSKPHVTRVPARIAVGIWRHLPRELVSLKMMRRCVCIPPWRGTGQSVLSLPCTLWRIIGQMQPLKLLWGNVEGGDRMNQPPPSSLVTRLDGDGGVGPVHPRVLARRDVAPAIRPRGLYAGRDQVLTPPILLFPLARRLSTFLWALGLQEPNFLSSIPKGTTGAGSRGMTATAFATAALTPAGGMRRHPRLAASWTSTNRDQKKGTTPTWWGERRL